MIYSGNNKDNEGPTSVFIYAFLGDNNKKLYTDGDSSHQSLWDIISLYYPMFCLPKLAKRNRAK